MSYKLGYFKVNSICGQFTFTVFIDDGNLKFKNFRYHPENTKDNNIIYCNVNQKNYLLYSESVMKYIANYIELYFNLSIDKFEIKINKLMGFNII